MVKLITFIKYFEIGIILCGLLCSVLFMVKKMRANKKNGYENNVIRQSKAWGIMGIVCIVLWFPMVVTWILFFKFDGDVEKYKENCAAISMLFLFALGCEIGFPQVVIWEIRFYEDRFVYTGAFGRKRTYFYDGIKVITRIVNYKGRNMLVYKYYRKGRRILALNSMMAPNFHALTAFIGRFMGERIYNLPMKRWYIDVEALRREETEWLKTASAKDRALYDRLIEKLKNGDENSYISDFIGNIKDATVLPYFEETVLFWENKKMQAITAYIAGNKENKNACDTVVKAYLSLSNEDKKRYASLYDKAIRCTITKDYVLSNMEWLSDWHAAFNLPKTVEKIGRGNLPELNQMWLAIVKQKNKLDNEYYDFEEAQKVLLPIVKRNMA